jgi:hypothetical protein
LSDHHDIQVTWFAAQSAGGLQPDDAVLGKYFKVTPYASLYSRHSVSNKVRVIPYLLEPKDGFHRLVSRALGLAETTRTPYDGLLWGGQLVGNITNVVSVLFPGDVMITRVTAQLHHPSLNDLRPMLSDLQAVRSPKNIKFVNRLMQEVTAMVHGKTSDSRNSESYDSYFTMNLKIVQPVDLFDSVIFGLRSELVALLIGTQSAELLREDIVDRVWDANEELNVKASRESMLLNRQGLLYILPKGSYRGPHLHRFGNTRDLVTLAMYARHFLRDENGYSTRHTIEAMALLKKIEQWILYPRLTFDASFSHTVTWTALSDQMLLDERLTAWLRFLEGIEPNEGNSALPD